MSLYDVMSGTGRLALPDVREWSGVPSGCPGVVGCPPGCPEVVKMPSRMFGSGRETLPNFAEWWEALLHVWKLSRGTPEIQEALLISGSDQETL